jgi:hypothetical protein
MKRLALLVLCGVAAGVPYSRADDAAAMAILQAGCTEDAQRLCAGVQPCGGRVIACLQQHKDALSAQCKQAAQQAMAVSGGNQAPTPSGPPSPSALPSSDATPPSPPAKAGAPSSAWVAVLSTTCTPSTSITCPHRKDNLRATTSCCC